MTSLANLIYAQTLYKYAIDNSVKSVTVSPDIPQPIAEYMASQVPKHPLVKTDILSLMGGSSSLSATQCQKWWRQMLSSTKIAEKELALSSLAKLVDGFRHVLYKETVASLKADEVTYKSLKEEMEREKKEKSEKERLDKEKLEKERLQREQEEEQKASKEKEDSTQAAQPTTKSDDDDVEMADAQEGLKDGAAESEEKPAEPETTETEEEPVKVKEEEKDTEVEAKTEKKGAKADEQEDKQEEAGDSAEADVEEAEESESDKETTADVETDRGETEEPDESELDRVTETPEAGATPGSEERTRKRARSTTEDSDSRKRSRRNTSAAPSANRKFQNVAGNLLSNISSNKSASFFTHPVNPNSAPNYYELIFSPTDIRTIKAQVKDGRISSTSELEREVAKMFANAIMYNPWDSDVNVWAREMQQETDALLTLFRGAGGE
ncbi:Bromodomain-containing protein 1 [Yarrowia sp. C11]|nr:Bromodomain-containing protein 1 [Yarrowia sp. E02]KAG5372100.1 Bromodomain-containing protein 1 [Yarrowia sp. C11]